MKKEYCLRYESVEQRFNCSDVSTKYQSYSTQMSFLYRHLVYWKQSFSHQNNSTLFIETNLVENTEEQV